MDIVFTSILIAKYGGCSMFFHAEDALQNQGDCIRHSCPTNRHKTDRIKCYCEENNYYITTIFRTQRLFPVYTFTIYTPRIRPGS